MKKIHFVFLACILFFPSLAKSSDAIYQRGNNPADFVNLEKVKKGNFNHPHTFTQEQMINMLRSLRYSQRNLIGKGEKIRFVYELEYINKYAPYLVEAFSKASPDKEVFWSVVQKRPYVIFRNDRLTQVAMWVTGQELHMRFMKTEAKLEGDYQAKTTGTKLIEDAKGLRIDLEPQEGQKFAMHSAQELILDLNQDWDRIATKVEIEDQKLQEEVKERKSKYKQSSAASAPSGTATSVPSAYDQKSAEARLTELKKLHDKGLISKEDYEKKKQEILEGL